MSQACTSHVSEVIDAAKCIAHRLGIPIVVCPTLASTDAPCSAVAVMYTADGVFSGAEFLPGNPDLVVVDTTVIAKAPLRYLVAGIADALATGYEARTCLNNPDARSMLGGRISLAAATIAQSCSDTVYAYADAAVAAAKAGIPDQALEHVVDANTLLSGTGFESAGLAAAHTIASALTVVPRIEHEFLHGEMVAVGIMVHLRLEERFDDLEKARTLLRRLGLPTCFGALGLDPDRDADAIDAIVDAACALPFMANEPFEVTPDRLRTAIAALELDAVPLGDR